MEREGEEKERFGIRHIKPGLHSTAYRATFPAFYAVVSSLYLLFV